MSLRNNPIRYTLLPALVLAGIGLWAGRKYLDLDLAIAWWIGINLVTYPIWWYDKRQARKGGFRVPEWTLHLLSLAGGGVAAVLAMRSLRHKTLKPVFRFLHPLLAIAGVVAAFGWWLYR